MCKCHSGTSSSTVGFILSIDYYRIYDFLYCYIGTTGYRILYSFDLGVRRYSNARLLSDSAFPVRILNYLLFS